MKITPINYSYRQSFRSTTRTTYRSHQDGTFVLPRFDKELHKTTVFSSQDDIKMVVSNSTNFFRKDIPWDTLCKLIRQKFPRGRVEIYDFACSDGSEAYSLAICLMEKFGKKGAQRFFPIHASDIDREIIRMANSKAIVASDGDKLSIEKAINKGGIDKYFSQASFRLGKDFLYPKEELLSAVSFEEKSIEQGLDEVIPSKRIILCRNFWKYLSKEDLAKSSWKLGQVIDKNTIVIIGDFDTTYDNKLPFYISALGLERISDKEDERNILELKSHKRNFIVTRNFESWEKYIDSKFENYVPPYIARNKY